jgi:hypothetical protein
MGIDVRSGPYIAKSYLVEDWDLVAPFCNALMGSLEVFGTTAVYTPAGVAPESTNLRALGVEAQPYELLRQDPDDGPPRFDWAKVTVNYGIPTWDSIAEEKPESEENQLPNETGQPYTYQTHEIDYDEEQVPLPVGAYHFRNSPQLKVNRPYNVHIGRATIRIVRQWYPRLPFDTVVGLLNRTNEDTFLGRDPGTIRFAKARTRQQFTSDGRRTQEFEMIFEWREFAWGKFPRPDSATFDWVDPDDGAAPMLYIQADLRPLLT